MMGYKDMTWCLLGDKCSDSKDCHRVFTEKDRENAIKWWGNEDFPITTFLGEPDCFKEIENENNSFTKSNKQI